MLPSLYYRPDVFISGLPCARRIGPKPYRQHLAAHQLRNVNGLEYCGQVAGRQLNSGQRRAGQELIAFDSTDGNEVVTWIHGPAFQLAAPPLPQDPVARSGWLMIKHQQDGHNVGTTTAKGWRCAVTDSVHPSAVGKCEQARLV